MGSQSAVLLNRTVPLTSEVKIARRRANSIPAECPARAGALTIPVIALLVALALTVAPCGCWASEKGTGTHPNGLVDLLAGLLAPPGTLIFKNYFFYWDASARIFTNGIEVANDVKAYADILQVVYATNARILGANYGFSLLIPFVIANEHAKQSFGNMPPFFNQTSTVGGLGDMILTPAALHWHFGRFHLLTACSAYAPSGTYDKNRLLNIGKNRWSFEPDVGLTWLDQETGREASTFIGYTVNLENTATSYKSGDEFHAEFALAQHLPKGYVLGMAGYAFQQTTGDSGQGAILGPFRGRVFALGPLGGYHFKIDKEAIDLTAKYEFEFGDQNRLAGNVLWLTGALEF